DKTEANLRVAGHLAELVGERGMNLDKAALLTAVRLAKADLTAELVKEFTELQGIVGGLYARAQGLGEKVAVAIYCQYSPSSTEDDIPDTIEGQLLGLADRLTTIINMFELGLAPSGSKDPFALRRAANGIVKILAESSVPVRIQDLVFLSSSSVARIRRASVEQKENVLEEVRELIKDRVEFYLREVRGFAYDVVNAVLAAGFDDVRDSIARAEALSEVRGSEDFAAISAAFKRMTNIVRQAREKGQLVGEAVSDALFSDPAERRLYDQANSLSEQVKVFLALDPSRYREALELVATLRPHVDLFFDKVMVMVDDAAVRQNRLALIAMVLGSFSSIADFSEIVTS
ncbi:MAG: glycine--tRNA ligase subunit beta, partial [Silvibacterium sp.]